MGWSAHCEEQQIRHRLHSFHNNSVREGQEKNFRGWRFNILCMTSGKSRRKMQNVNDDKRSAINITMTLMIALGVFVFVYLCQTLSSQPLFPFQNESLDWCRTWLYMTVVDYYGSTWALSAIIAWSESPIVATCWILSISLLGSPFACAYIVYRLYKHNNLSLEIGNATSGSSMYNGIPSRL